MLLRGRQSDFSYKNPGLGPIPPDQGERNIEGVMRQTRSPIRRCCRFAVITRSELAAETWLWLCEFSDGPCVACSHNKTAQPGRLGRDRRHSDSRSAYFFSKSPGFGNSTGTPSALQVFAAHKRSRSFGVACTMKW